MFASDVAIRGNSMKAIQALLCHAMMEMTMRDAHIVPVVHRGALDVLSGSSPFIRENHLGGVVCRVMG